MVTHQICFICSICGECVDITTCVTDEFGKHVHELCYVEKLSRESEFPQNATSEQLRALKLLRVLDDVKQHSHRSGT